MAIKKFSKSYYKVQRNKTENQMIDLENKLDRQMARLVKFGKNLSSVESELDQLTRIISQLNNHLQSVTDESIRVEIETRLEALNQRKALLKIRAPEYLPEVRASIEKTIEDLKITIEEKRRYLANLEQTIESMKS